jgi:hypothetical protein
MKSRILATLAIVAAIAVAPTARAAIRITEWMYTGNPGEYVELTNIGGAPIDMTGWSYSDEDDEPGMQSLSAFGIVNPGESVIFTEASSATFKAAWGIPTVDVVGGVTDNLGRTDAIYIYDSTCRRNHRRSRCHRARGPNDVSVRSQCSRYDWPVGRCRERGSIQDVARGGAGWRRTRRKP